MLLGRELDCRKKVRFMDGQIKNTISRQAKHRKLIETHTNNIKISDMNLDNKYTILRFQNCKKVILFYMK